MRMIEWLDVVGYEKTYMISNTGLLKSLKRNTAHERIMKPQIDKGGYVYFNLTKDGIRKSKKAHRLVAEAFIPNPDNKYSVNHINGNKQDNRVENLEWATMAEQASHAVETGLWKWSDESKNKLRNTLKNRGKLINKDKNTHTRGHKFGYVQVVQKDDNGNVIKIWDSINNASQEIGVPASHIVRVCKGLRKHTRGFVWEYLKEGD